MTNSREGELRVRRKKIRRDCTYVRLCGEKAECKLFGGVDCEYCGEYCCKSQKSTKNIESEESVIMESKDIINTHTPTGFEPVVLGDGDVRAYVSNGSGVTFTKGVMNRLNKPEYIEISLDKANRRLAVRGCDANARTAVQCKTNSTGGCRFNRRELLTIVTESMGIDVSRGAYCVNGRCRDGVVIFEFCRAVKLKIRRNKP